MSKDYNKLALELHEKYEGKLEIRSKVPLKTKDDLSIAYTPGVAKPCLLIEEDESLSYKYTNRGNTIGVISDGTAVLGLGNIGALGSMPVMEGKCILFKEFGNVDAIPIIVEAKSKEELVTTIYNISKSFGGINLEDIKAPECFYVEEELKKICDIPIFHDDQHGTAVVTIAALINSAKVVNKELKDLEVVVNGAGAAGISIVYLLNKIGVHNIVMCDSKGSIYKGRVEGMNPYKEKISLITNKNLEKGSLKDVIMNKDVFIGVSAPDVLSKEDIMNMNKDSIVMAMSNPDPEIDPVLAKEGGAKVICTGRSDYDNQVNNVLAFPGILRGALNVRAHDITLDMKIAAAFAIASLVTEEELTGNYVIPNPLDRRVAKEVTKAVEEAYKKEFNIK